MNRTKHLNWCKQRALEYVDRDDLDNALASMFSDLGKHEDTKNHSGIQLGLMLKASGDLNTPEKMRKFIKGFN